MDKEQAIEIIETHSDDISSSSLLGLALNMAIEALKAQLSQQGTTKGAISRQAAIDAVEKNACNTQRIMDAVNNLPPVQPEHKKGKWIYNSPVTMKCDQCGLVIKDWDWHRFKICPNCGSYNGGERK